MQYFVSHVKAAFTGIGGGGGGNTGYTANVRDWLEAAGMENTKELGIPLYLGAVNLDPNLAARIALIAAAAIGPLVEYFRSRSINLNYLI